MKFLLNGKPSVNLIVSNNNNGAESWSFLKTDLSNLLKVPLGFTKVKPIT